MKAKLLFALSMALLGAACSPDTPSVQAQVGDRVYFAHRTTQCRDISDPIRYVNPAAFRELFCQGYINGDTYGTVMKINKKDADRPDLWDYCVKTEEPSCYWFFPSSFTVVTKPMEQKK